MTANEKIKILSVDDNDANLYTRGRLLRREGFEVVEASNGADALRLVAELKPPLVLLDVQMPDINGLEVCRRIKNDPALISTYVLQISASLVEPQDKARALNGGADAYLAEPVEPEVLLATVRALLRLQKAETDLRASQQHLAMALAAGRAGTFEWNIENNNNYWSPELEKMYGVPSGTFENNFEAWEKRVVPEDAATVKAGIKAALAQRQDEYQYEFRALMPDGEHCWLAGRAKFEYDSDGKPLCMIGTNVDINKRKQAEAQVEQLNQRNRDVLESITEAFFSIDEDWRFTYVNQQAETLLGRQPGDLLGRVIWDEFPGIKDSEFEQAYRRAARERMASTVVAYYPAHERWYEVDVYPAPNGITIYFRNVTERKRAEEALRKSEEQFRSFVAASSDSLYRMSANWSEMRDLQGTNFLASTEDPSHTWLESYIPEADQARVLAVIQEAIRNKSTFELEHQVIRADGTIGWTFSRAIPLLDAGGEIIEWFGAASDVTARKQAEELRQKSLESEQAARTQAEEANRLKDEFLATLSHELRTPLNAILGWSQILQNRTLDSNETEKALRTIERNARAQNQLIDDLLDVSRIISGKLRLDVQAVDLASVIAASVEAARPAADAKNIRLQLLLDPMAGLISGDADRLQQVVWNLLSNAIKFTPKNGRVQVRLERIDSHVEIVVSDTGRGIEPEFLPYVFDRFRQSDGSMTRRHGGLGLGLAIVRQLVELHGGTVSVSSNGEGAGATFTVSLPFLPVRREAKINQSQMHLKAQTGVLATNCSPELDRLRILLVDDEADSRDLLNLVLESCGAQVVTASSAAEALETVKRERFDVLISDIGMPMEDGFSLIGKIRELPNELGGAVPALALTAYARAEDRVRALRSGFQMHVAKPVDSSELIVAVANLAKGVREHKI